jgi:hypothetical protein
VAGDCALGSAALDQREPDYITTVVAIFGTTISPYLFFWQASQEVEDLRADPNAQPLKHATEQACDQLKRINIDTVTGMGFSNLVAMFIMLTTAATLGAHGITHIESSAQAAEALRPIAGDFAFALFSMGIIGTGLLAVPVLAGSAAYAIAGAMRWKNSLELQLSGAEVLCHHYWRHAGRHRHVLHLDRSDPGAVLERRGQWRDCGAGDGGGHAAGRTACGHGRVRDFTPPARAGLAVHGRDGAGGAGDVCHTGVSWHFPQEGRCDA